MSYAQLGEANVQVMLYTVGDFEPGALNWRARQSGSCYSASIDATRRD